MAVFKFAVLLTLLIGIPAYIYFYHYEIISGFNNIEDVENYIARYGTASAFIYIGFQVVQIVICIIPGQVIQIAAGYLYGFLTGYFLSIAGIAIGTFCTFYLARILGKDALHILFGKSKFTKMVGRLNSRRALIIIFIIYVIPGLPKDLAGYAAGMSKMKFPPFLFLSLAGRTPALMGSILLGSMAEDENYIFVIVIAIVFAVLFGIAFIKRNAIAVWFEPKEKIDKE